MIGTAIFPLLIATATATPAIPVRPIPPLNQSVKLKPVGTYGTPYDLKGYKYRVKLDDEWYELNPGNTILDSERDGKPVKERFVVRIWFQEFKYQDYKILTQTFLTYRDYQKRGSSSWILEGNTVSMVTYTMSGDFDPDSVDWDDTNYLFLPVIGSRSPTIDQIKPYLQAANGNTDKGLERYVSNSTVAAYPTYIDNMDERDWVLPVFPDSTDGEVWFHLPTLDSEENDSIWDESYFFTNKKTMQSILAYMGRRLN
ncbi:MAG: hypothetical protein JNM28_02710 [Armatimonadetes bacterium]|nr:hypothetical protein [Armatimonadota bacterium]MBS1712003.1 hypothetical protein [Armatimonadota bacterium]MBX3109443.1 hypothetical protein [Fimbriimonadaceae bacterium]